MKCWATPLPLAWRAEETSQDMCPLVLSCVVRSQKVQMPLTSQFISWGSVTHVMASLVAATTVSCETLDGGLRP